MLDPNGKDTAVTTARTKPTLVTIGNRQMISSGRWNNECVANFVLARGRDGWITVGELARIAYGQNTPRSKERVRQCLHQLFKHFLRMHGELLVTEYGPPRNRAIAVKLYSPASEIDRQSIAAKIHRMRKRSEITVEQYALAIELLQEKDAPVTTLEVALQEFVVPALLAVPVAIVIVAIAWLS